MTLYDIFWEYPCKMPARPLAVPVGDEQSKADTPKDAIPAVILYPALTTPDIVWGVLPGLRDHGIFVSQDKLPGLSEDDLKRRGLRKAKKAAKSGGGGAVAYPYEELDETKLELLIAFREEDLAQKPEGRERDNLVVMYVGHQLKVGTGCDPMRPVPLLPIPPGSVEAKPCDKPKLKADETYE
ncbi:MAG: hypothetical protein ACYSU0_00950, partial [Planctomycetota bacterium]